MHIQETVGDKQERLHAERFKWEKRLAADNGWVTNASSRVRELCESCGA